MSTSSLQSLVESAIQYANTTLANMNSTMAQAYGVDVLWFRLRPDKRNQDVVFQSYTLYGVEDCPISIKCLYTDNSYDDAALTYNIMGIEYQVPLTLEMAPKDWYAATGQDGTLPQRGDIVFIPLSQKLLEVVSFTPVKKIAAQITSFKVNLSVYKPSRSRIVGENLQQSIEENTVNIDTLFGEKIADDISDIVDDEQTSMFNSTSRDKYKDVAKTTEEDSIIQKISNIHSEDIIVDGHIVARSYYDMNISEDIVLKYKKEDYFSTSEYRCLSEWIRIKDNTDGKNIKLGTFAVGTSNIVLNISGQLGLEVGDEIVVERGNISFTGIVTTKAPYTLTIDKTTYDELTSISENWNKLPGYTFRKCNRVNLLSSDAYTIDLLSGKVVDIYNGKKHIRITVPISIDQNEWYGWVINFGSKISINVFSSNNFKKLWTVSDISNKRKTDYEIPYYYIKSSNADITNIRLYNTKNDEVDRQMMDMLSYNIKNNSQTIINDSADIPLNQKYMGEQR